MSCIQLSKRLYSIAEMVPKGTFLADIGTDHAFLPIYLLENSIIEKAIAADIVDGPLEIAKKNIKAHNLGDKISIVKSDGLVNVKTFTPETIVIAGMGGETIRDILKNLSFSKDYSPFFLLQPMTHTEILREFLFKTGVSILSEKVVREKNRYYVIISAQFLEKQQHYFAIESFSEICELGAIMPNSCEDARDYLIWKKGTLERNIANLENSEDCEDKKEALSKTLFEINRRLNLCQE